MGRKRNPYLPLYTRDIMSSPRCRALSCQATGVYLWLLCRLNEPPTPGAFRLSDWEAHPTWKRSLTQQCLAEPDKQRRLQYFARYLAKNDLPWDRKEVLDGLQELYRMGIVVVEGDMLVQPRMYKDNGFELPDFDNDGDPEGTILDDAASGSMAVKDDEELSENNSAENGTEKGTQNGTEKVQRKAPVSHAGATRTLSVEIMSNNIVDKGNIGGAGGDAPLVKPMQKSCKNKKTPLADPKHQNKPSGGVSSSEVVNVSSDEQKAVSGHEKGVNDNSKGTPVADCPPTLEEIQRYMQEQGELGKPFRFITADQFYDEGCMNGWQIRGGQPLYDWKARLRSLEAYRRSHGDRPATDKGFVAYQQGQPKAGDPVAATPAAKGKYKNKW